VPTAHVEAALGDPGPLRGAGVLIPGSDAGALRADVEIRPYAAEGYGPGERDAVAPLDGWVCHDPVPTLDGRIAPVRPDYVLGASPASTTLAQLTIRRPVGRALDLGTGCGVQSLHLAGHADHVVATDLNPRAVALAGLTAALNGVNLDLREGSLYDPVAHEAFDLIVSNPPYVMSPPAGDRLTYREGSLPGDELVRRVVTGGARRLAPGGTLQVLGNWAIVEGEPWPERLAAWVAPTGCDALVLQRERLDPYEYIELWLGDAGLVGTPEYARRYAEWAAYFRSLHITGVGLGWISLHRAGRRHPDVRCEEWPHAVHQPLGEAFSAQQRAVALADRSDAELLATSWVLDPRVDQETVGRPGAEDPDHVVLRQRYGFGRAVEVDTALGAVAGASDGDLPVGVLIGAVAGLLGADAAALAAELTPRLRALVRDGYLTA